MNAIEDPGYSFSSFPSLVVCLWFFWGATVAPNLMKMIKSRTGAGKEAKDLSRHKAVPQVPNKLPLISYWSELSHMIILG